jgi:hypothetical protein
VVAREVRDRDARIRPRREQTEKSGTAFRYEVAVLNVFVEDVADQIEVIDVCFVCLQAADEVGLLRALRSGVALTEVHVGDEEDQAETLSVKKGRLAEKKPRCGRFVTSVAAGTSSKHPSLKIS